MEIVYEPNSCVCDGDGADQALFECRDLNFAATAEQSSFLRCGGCGSLRPAIFPTPDTLGLAYRQYYTEQGTSPRGTLRQAVSGFVRSRNADYHLRLLPKDAASVLDFGCGSGAYLRAAKAEQPEIAAYGTDTLKSPAFPSDLATWVDEADLPSLEGLDHVTLGHVIEHVPDPVATVRQIARLLRPGGQLWIATPNARSFLIGAFGARARDVDFPRHRILLSRERLEALLKENGFSEVAFHMPSRIHAIANAVQSVDNVRRDSSLSTSGKLLAILKGAASVVRFVLRSQGKRLELEPELIVIARRTDRAVPLAR